MSHTLCLILSTHHTVCHSMVVSRKIQHKIYGINARTKERRVTHVKARKATGRCLPKKRVLLCLDLFGQRSRDQLSQTADFVQIHLIYPQWFTGTPHLHQTALCLRTISDKLTCKAAPHHIRALYVPLKKIRLSIVMHHKKVITFRWATNAFFFPVIFFFFFQGPPLVWVHEQSRLVESNLLRVILFN